MIDEHRSAFEYDWRSRFHLGLSEVGRSMPWGEAVRLARVLWKDPTSHIAAAVNDWDRPWSFEWAATVDLFDLQHRRMDKRSKPYPRPWRDPNARRRGRTTRTRAEVIAILNAHGHEIGGASHG